MEAKLEKGRLSVNLFDVLNYMGDEDRAYLIEALSCEEQIVAHVAAQIVDGWTENGSHSGVTYGALPATPLDKAKRLLAKSASDVAKREIESLERRAAQAEARADEYLTKMVKAERALDDYKRTYA